MYEIRQTCRLQNKSPLTEIIYKKNNNCHATESKKMSYVTFHIPQVYQLDSNAGKSTKETSNFTQSFC